MSCGVFFASYAHGARQWPGKDGAKVALSVPIPPWLQARWTECIGDEASFQQSWHRKHEKGQSSLIVEGVAVLQPGFAFESVLAAFSPEEFLLFHYVVRCFDAVTYRVLDCGSFDTPIKAPESCISLAQEFQVHRNRRGNESRYTLRQGVAWPTISDASKLLGRLVVGRFLSAQAFFEHHGIDCSEKIAFVQVVKPVAELLKAKQFHAVMVPGRWLRVGPASQKQIKLLIHGYPPEPWWSGFSTKRGLAQRKLLTFHLLACSN